MNLRKQLLSRITNEHSDKNISFDKLCSSYSRVLKIIVDRKTGAIN